MTAPESQFAQHPESSGEPFAAGLTVVVIGARRVRQGTGPYLALQAARAGAHVAGVLGTRPTSARKAAEWLQEQGLCTAAYVDHEQMLEELCPDVVIVASPLGTHRAWLGASLDVGAHVYCEKPMIAAPAGVALDLLEQYAAANLVLAENCQWPQVMPAFQALHPKVDLNTVKSFRMLMAPPMRGLTRWHEVLSHPLSLIQEVMPGPADLEDVVYQESGPDALDTRLRFTYRTMDRALACEVMLEDMNVFPRPAEFAFDDALCRRVVEPSDYSITFVDGSDACIPVAIPDPMEANLRAFLHRVLHAKEVHSAPLDESLVRRQFLLEHLLELYRESVHG
ncbi:MAG: Gfo/Idh/MocA family oxidoreductase [Planctomycetota bacterium]|nr:Gfo/Idh/MocA family oxidoreductase [Planctomycetota bacterium]MDA1114770.1 Gfo/Idh/MocA family oxidoreductase [Planctomycetota bacterium]